MSISQAVYEAQIQRIADLQARLADLEAERELIVQRAENAEAALAEAEALLRDIRAHADPFTRNAIGAYLSRNG